MNRHPFRAICAVAASAFALLAVCGCAARPEEALNQALEALNAQQAGQFRILNLCWRFKTERPILPIWVGMRTASNAIINTKTES